MPRKPTGKVMRSLIYAARRNGDTYVFLRETVYDPKVRYNRVLGKRLIGKIPKGQTELVPTRPKAKDGEEPEDVDIVLEGKRLTIAEISEQYRARLEAYKRKAAKVDGERRSPSAGGVDGEDRSPSANEVPGDDQPEPAEVGAQDVEEVEETEETAFSDGADADDPEEGELLDEEEDGELLDESDETDGDLEDYDGEVPEEYEADEDPFLDGDFEEEPFAEVSAGISGRDLRWSGGRAAPLDFSSGSDSYETRPAGLMDIIRLLGRDSGLEEDLYEAFGREGDTSRILSMAQYLFATDQGPLSGLDHWRRIHGFPGDGIFREKDWQNLLAAIGEDSFKTSCFLSLRSSRFPLADCFACQTSVNSPSADGIVSLPDLQTSIPCLFVCSQETGQPVAFSRQSWNLTPPAALDHALTEAGNMGLRVQEVLGDLALCDEPTIFMLLQKNVHFIAPMSLEVPWVKQSVDDNLENLNWIESRLSVDPDALHGLPVQVNHTFSRDSVEDHVRRTETITRTVYLHIYSDNVPQTSQLPFFERTICDLRALLLQTRLMDSLSDPQRTLAEQYLIVNQNEDGVVESVDYNSKAIRETIRHTGIFVLMADEESDPREALRKYRSKESIDGFFRTCMRDPILDPNRFQGKGMDGPVLAQFLAFCYLRCFEEKVRTIREELQKTLDRGPGAISREQYLTSSRLLRWLNRQSAHQILNWFDGNEAAGDGSTGLMSSDDPQRDRLFLRMLGLPEDSMS